VNGPDPQREASAAPGRLISFGGLLADLVVSVDAVPERGADALARDFTQTIGGGFAVIAAAARLGMPTALAGVLGEDPIADATRRALRADGIELLFPEPRAGSSGVCLEDFDAVAPASGDVIYINGYELLYPHATGLANWVRRVRPDHLVFDPGPLIAAIDPDALQTMLGATRWLSLNAAEAKILTGEDDPATAALTALRQLPAPLGVDGPKSAEIERFSAHQRGVVVRDGAEGCVVVERGGEPVSVPAFPVATVDTTGAGDTHVGAFIAALARGLDPVEACRWANAAAAAVVASRGQVSPPRLEELQAILAVPAPRA
jgi:ribokinase